MDKAPKKSRAEEFLSKAADELGAAASVAAAAAGKAGLEASKAGMKAALQAAGLRPDDATAERAKRGMDLSWLPKALDAIKKKDRRRFVKKLSKTDLRWVTTCMPVVLNDF